MKKSLLLQITLLLLFPLALSSQTKPVSDALQNGDPAAIKINDYLGERINACIEHRVKSQDVNHLVQPFYNKTETRMWQSEFLGKWLLGAVLSYRYSHDPVLLDSIKTGVTGLLGSQLPNGYIGNYSEAAQNSCRCSH